MCLHNVVVDDSWKCMTYAVLVRMVRFFLFGELASVRSFGLDTGVGVLDRFALAFCFFV